jgi:capsular polysaccharide biosynthesis protein
MTSNLMLSFIISLLFTAGIVLFLEYLDDTLKTEEDIIQVLGVPTLANVAKIEKKDMVGKSRANKSIKAGEASYAAANR